MKSIKEKAKEVFPEHCNFYTNSCNERKRIGFEAGANYVLEIFKEIIENRNFCAFPKSVHQELLDKIKELKGE